MINRRHHCRNCGAVVCGPCSSKKFILPGQSNKPLRVCLDCYDNLTSLKRDGNKSLPGNNNKPANSTESSGEDDSGDDEETLKDGVTHDEPTFYGDDKIVKLDL